MASRRTRPVLQPVDFSDEDAMAAQAVEAGVATPGQMRTFTGWLVRETRMKDEIFVAGADDARCFLLGKRSVGLRWAELLQHRGKQSRRVE